MKSTVIPDALDRTGQIKQSKPHRAPRHTHTSLSNTLPQTQGETFKRQASNAPQSTPRNGLSGCRWSRVITQQCFSSRSTSQLIQAHPPQMLPQGFQKMLPSRVRSFVCLFFNRQGCQQNYSKLQAKKIKTDHPLEHTISNASHYYILKNIYEQVWLHYGMQNPLFFYSQIRSPITIQFNLAQFLFAQALKSTQYTYFSPVLIT